MNPCSMVTDNVISIRCDSESALFVILQASVNQHNIPCRGRRGRCIAGELVENQVLMNSYSAKRQRLPPFHQHGIFGLKRETAYTTTQRDLRRRPHKSIATMPSMSMLTQPFTRTLCHGVAHESPRALCTICTLYLLWPR